MTKGDYIPDCILADILSKLPAKSLLRFKIVCKTWYSLISDPVFINLHTKQASRNPKILITTFGSDQLQLLLLDYERPSFNDSCLSDPIKFPLATSVNGAKVMGSSCGLVCVEATNYYGNNFYILNPLTRECRKVPKLDGYIDRCCYFHGLGYDSVANDFKFVISLDAITWNIFSLKENSWKIIKSNIIQNAFEDQNVYVLPFSRLATIVNGMLYWFGVPVALYGHPDSDPAFIVAFDVAKETVETLQFPIHMSWESRRHATLLEHTGCLCVSFLKLGSCPPLREIWMMKEYGSWVHLLTFKISTPYDSNFQLPCLFISITRNEVVCHTGLKKFSSCGREKEVKITTQQDVYPAVLYVETLVSPNAKDK